MGARASITPVTTEIDGDTVELVGNVLDVRLVLVDLDYRLAGTVQSNADADDARLVEKLGRVLLLRGDGLVIVLVFVLARGRTLPGRRGRERDCDEQRHSQNDLSSPEHRTPGLSFETHPLGAHTLVPRITNY